MAHKRFVEGVARRTGLKAPQALHVAASVLRSLVERAGQAAAWAVADELGGPFAELLGGDAQWAVFDLDELVSRVQLRTGTTRELALSYLAAVAMTLSEILRAPVLSALREALPPAIAFLLRPPAASRSPPPRPKRR